MDRRLGELLLHARIVARPRAVGPGRPRPDEQLLEEALLQVRIAHRLLEPEGEADDGPALIDLADPRAVRDAHAAQREGVRPLAAQRVHRSDLDARRVGGDEEHREAAVRAVLTARARQREDVLRDVGRRRPHLLAVDDPVVAVAARLGARGGDVRAGSGSL